MCFTVVNSKGGVNGFMEDRSNFALFNCMGTPMIEAMLPKVIESGIPFFAPFSGAMSVRPKIWTWVALRSALANLR